MENKFNMVFQKAISFVLIAAMALTLSCCAKNKTPNKSADSAVASAVSEHELGNGKNHFDFTVTDKVGNQTIFKIKTDKKTVGDALLELGLISGTDSDYGLYVKNVNGIELDFDKDGYYWAFYENGKYAQSGVEKTEITNGSSYEFKAQK